jgi:hypothetical protein
MLYQAARLGERLRQGEEASDIGLEKRGMSRNENHQELLN